MIKILIFILITSINFSKNNSSFLEPNTEKINFVYENYLQDTVITNNAEIIFYDSSIRFENHEILLVYHDNVVQTYNKKFNQIIIENSEKLLFNIIIKLLKKIKNKKFNVMKNKNKIIDYKIGNYDALLDFKNGEINSLSINIDGRLSVAHSLKYTSLESSINHFQINRPDAFVIDLRD